MQYKNINIMTAKELIKKYQDGERDFRCADLSYADLSGANISRADLSGAYLSGAIISFMQDDLIGEKITLYNNTKLFSFNKESGRLCFLIKTETKKIVICGCYINTLEAFELRCKEKYQNNPIQAYEPQIAYLKTL